MLDITRVRAETGVVDRLLYFNNARVSPCPRPTLDAIQECVTREYCEGWTFMSHGQVLERVKNSVADLLRARAEEIAITQSATHAFNLLVNAIDWRTGDNVIVTDLAYRSVMIALMRVRDRDGVTIRVARSSDLVLDPDHIESLVDPRTRLVVVPYIPTFAGTIQPVKEIGLRLSSTTAMYAINATQAVGQLPIDVSEASCDFLFGTSRKWLRGPRGLGMLYIRKDLIPELTPTNVGYVAGLWTGPESYALAPSVDKFHTGDFPYALMVGLKRSTEYAIELGLENIQARISQIASYARQALSETDVRVLDISRGVTGTVPTEIPNVDADEFVEWLLNQGVAASVIYEENNLLGLQSLGIQKLVRFSFSYFNTTQEIDELIEIVNRYAR